jgi:hypothetical protein
MMAELRNKNMLPGFVEEIEIGEIEKIKVKILISP